MIGDCHIVRHPDRSRRICLTGFKILENPVFSRGCSSPISSTRNTGKMRFAKSQSPKTQKFLSTSCTYLLSFGANCRLPVSIGKKAIVAGLIDDLEGTVSDFQMSILVYYTSCFAMYRPVSKSAEMRFHRWLIGGPKSPMRRV